MVATKPSSTNLATCSIADFAAAVHHALRSVGTAKTERYGGRKVFISAAWRAVAKVGGADDLSFDTFKRRLLDGVRTGDLQMARADLVGAMDPTTVRASEINDLGSSFHFIIDPAGRDPWDAPASPAAPDRVYSSRVEDLLAKLPAMTERDFALLAVACADQAGLSVAAQDKLAEDLGVSEVA